MKWSLIWQDDDKFYTGFHVVMRITKYLDGPYSNKICYEPIEDEI